MLREARDPTRLGQDLGSGGARLSEEAMQRSALAIRTLAQVARVEGATHVRAVATAAVREASNRHEFVERVRVLAGIELEVLSEDDEARLAFDGVAHTFDFSHAVGAVADIGGGSLEVVLSVHGVPFRAVSMPLGAVRLTRQFGGPEKSSGSRFAAMRRHVRSTLRAELDEPPRAPSLVVGTGGTFSSLAWLTIAKGYAPSGPAAPKLLKELPRAAISRTRVRKLLDNLRPLPVAARVGTEKIPPDRADVIIAGLVVVDELLRHLGVDSLRAHDAGLRDGLLLSLAGRALEAGTARPRRGSAMPGEPESVLSTAQTLAHVREFAKRCRYERAHAEQVARLAVSIFDQLAGEPPEQSPAGFFAPRTRLLLEAAAVLHDVGIAVGYRRHHKHSRDMIRLADLRGLDARERELVAVVARYHRKSAPDLEHAEFRSLDAPDRALAAGLAGILRIADGLDRSHRRVVRGAKVSLHPAQGAPASPEQNGTAGPRRGTCVFSVRARTHAKAELAAARRKADVFEGVFGIRAAPAEASKKPARRPAGASARSAT